MPFNPETVWVIWLGLFLFFELWAALDKRKGNTLSETIGDWIGVPKWMKGARRFAPLRRLVLGFFLVALGLHLVWGTSVVPVIGFGAVLAVVIFIGLREK